MVSIALTFPRCKKNIATSFGIFISLPNAGDLLRGSPSRAKQLMRNSMAVRVVLVATGILVKVSPPSVLTCLWMVTNTLTS
jgi:hypothetical protein